MSITEKRYSVWQSPSGWHWQVVAGNHAMSGIAEDRVTARVKAITECLHIAEAEAQRADNLRD
jgi:hypothetical protein